MNIYKRYNHLVNDKVVFIFVKLKGVEKLNLPDTELVCDRDKLDTRDLLPLNIILYK